VLSSKCTSTDLLVEGVIHNMTSASTLCGCSNCERTGWAPQHPVNNGRHCKPLAVGFFKGLHTVGAVLRTGAQPAHGAL
jgi:hypothetical protein